MHLTLSVRQFEKIIINETILKIVDYNILDLKSKFTNIDLNNLHFLSTNPDIVKLYPKLKIDFTQKFYDTTKIGIVPPQNGTFSVSSSEKRRRPKGQRRLAVCFDQPITVVYTVDSDAPVIFQKQSSGLELRLIMK